MAKSIDALLTVTWTGIVARTIAASCVPLAIAVARGIHANQEERIRRVREQSAGQQSLGDGPVLQFGWETA